MKYINFQTIILSLYFFSSQLLIAQFEFSNSPLEKPIQSVAPIYSKIGDLNGDSKPDIAIANYSNGNISIFLGQGDGSFSWLRNVSARVNPMEFVIVDLNNDQQNDLVVPNEGSDDISVLLNTGNGTFANSVEYTVGDAPRQIASSDLNKDGNPDIAVLNSKSNTVSVFLGTSTGTLTNKTDYSTGQYPFNLALKDLNNDNKDDLIINCFFEQENLSIRFGGSSGNFGGASLFSTDTQSDYLAITDINNDNKQDIITGSSNYGRISVAVGLGNGNFEMSYFTKSISNFTGLKVTDMNGDGKVDIITGNTSKNAISVLIGLGKDTANFKTLTEITTVANPEVIEVGNLNSDNKPDIVFTRYNDPNLYANAMINDPVGAFLSSSINVNSTEFTEFAGKTAILSWPTLYNASEYCIRYSKTTNFISNITENCKLLSPKDTFKLDNSGLRIENNIDTIYYQVAGIDSKGNKSLWSKTQSFVLNYPKTTGILSNNEFQKLNVYPNPVIGESLIINNLDQVNDLHIFSTTGHLIKSYKTSTSSSELRVNLQPGVYFIKHGYQILPFVKE